MSKAGEHVEDSAGTPVVVDERSIPISGTISRIDLKTGRSTAELNVGLHPADLKLSDDGSELYVANSNSDQISIIDTSTFKVRQSLSVRPHQRLPFGSIPNSLALSKDGHSLFITNAGNNTLAVADLAGKNIHSAKLKGFIPTGWFPGAVCTDNTSIFVANVKGEPSRFNTPKASSWSSLSNRGSISKIPIPNREQLALYSKQARTKANDAQMNEAQESARTERKAVPIPERVGEPSCIEHVVYVIKENRTYDQIFGDMSRGNNDPKLCTYGSDVTPNHHALAENFVLLDNYYCNGVVSADGHQWATQGIVTDYQEKMFGGHVRSYDFGSDSLCFAACNFLWDSVLARGLTVRNYGEFDFPKLLPERSNWYDVYEDSKKQNPQITMQHSVPMQTLRKHTCTEYAGWNLAIPDTIRIKSFLNELRTFEETGQWPNLLIVYLPQDHTAGLGEDHPSPRAFVADNDLALGQLVDAVSHSKFWSKTAIFVNEDDPQDGWDHVDGHRSLCLVISPYAKRREVVSQFYNQLSVLHSIQRIFGLPGSNQLTQQAPLMNACFNNVPDFTPYTSRPNQIALDEHNKRQSSLDSKERKLFSASKRIDFSRPDRADEDTFNKILWYSSKGINAPYPAKLSGAHGTGLKELNLKLSD